MHLLERLEEFCRAATPEERESAERMVMLCGEYVDAVVRMEVQARNIAGREELPCRTLAMESDRARTRVHDRLIACVDEVNLLCEANGTPPLYTGDGSRRSYGDFAAALAGELFAARR